MMLIDSTLASVFECFACLPSYDLISFVLVHQSHVDKNENFTGARQQRPLLSSH